MVSRIVEILEEDEESGMRANEIAKRMKMNVGILEPFLSLALRNGQIAIDKQDLMGGKYFPNSIPFWSL